MLGALKFREFLSTRGGIKPAIESGPEGELFRPIRRVVFPLLLLALLTVLARLGDFDLAIQEAIYRAGGNSWELGTRSLWWFLYKFGTIPAAVVCILAVIGFVMGGFREKWKRWRQCFVFVVLLGVVGPGVISNLILKEHWGRPRPRSTEGMGGQNKFEPVLTMDKSSNGKSFPCGHATMGYFFMGGFFLLRRYRRDWAWLFLILGLCLGFFMGVARMCQGGHYFSDVIWSGAIIYFTGMGLYYLLGLHKGLTKEPSNKPVPVLLKVAVPVLGVALLAGILLGTPYREVRNYRLITDHGRSNPLHIILTLKAGTIKILPGEEFNVSGEAWGHGVPTSKVAVHFVEYDRKNYTQVHYKERMSGRFTEVAQDLKITLPWNRIESLTVGADDCIVQVSLPAALKSPKRLKIAEGQGEIVFQALPSSFSWTDAENRSRHGLPGDELNGGGMIIDITPEFQGNLSLER